MKNPYVLFLFFTSIWLLIWFSTLNILSFLSGWRELAKYYRYQNEVILKMKYFQTASMRWGAHYGSCLTIGGNKQGLYISILFLFSAGHPKLFIPWDDIKIENKKILGFFPALELSIAKAPSIKVMFFQSMEKFFQEIREKPLAIEETSSIKVGEFDFLSVVLSIIDLILFIIAVSYLIKGQFSLSVNEQYQLITPQNNPKIFWGTEAVVLFVAFSLCAYIFYRIRVK